MFKQQYESKSKTKNYRKIEIKKLNNKKQKSVGETLEYIQKKKDASFSINDLLGEKCDIDLDILSINFTNYEPSKTSSKTMGVVKAYGANTYI